MLKLTTLHWLGSDPEHNFLNKNKVFSCKNTHFGNPYDYICMILESSFRLLTLKAPIMTAADDKFCNTFPNFQQK